MFCVECGKVGKTYDGLCESCHLSRRHFVSLPEIIDVQVCGTCFAARIGKNWVPALSVEKAIRLTVEASLEKERSVTDAEIRLELRQRDLRNYLADATVAFTAEDFSAEKQFKINVRLKKDTCQRCGKKSGHYYEATIQLRGPQEGSLAKRLSAARDEIIGRVDRQSLQNRELFISREEKVNGGYDFYISSTSVAKSLAKDISRMFGASSKVSNSLVGKKDGQELTRMTYLIRLPEYSPGDILLLDGRYYLLRSFDGNKLALTDLLLWQESTMTIGRLSTIEVAARRDELTVATVITDSANELQILDPGSNTPVDIIKPKKFGDRRSTVSFVKTKNGFLLIP